MLDGLLERAILACVIAEDRGHAGALKPSGLLPRNRGDRPEEEISAAALLISCV